MRALRSLAVGAAIVCAVGAVAACADTVNGSGKLDAARSSAPTGSPSGPSGSPTGFPSSGASTGAQGALASYLVAAPASSQRGTSTWATTTSPTVEAFVQHFYDADQVTGEVARLRGDGITSVAHNLWIHNGIQSDVVLLQFGAPSGALTRYTGIVAATRLDPTLRAAPASGPGDITEFYATKVDNLGNIASRAYAIKGDITVEVFLFSPKTFDGTDLTSYATAQVDKLP